MNYSQEQIKDSRMLVTLECSNPPSPIIWRPQKMQRPHELVMSACCGKVKLPNQMGTWKVLTTSTLQDHLFIFFNRPTRKLQLWGTRGRRHFPRAGAPLEMFTQQQQQHIIKAWREGKLAKQIRLMKSSCFAAHRHGWLPTCPSGLCHLSAPTTLENALTGVQEDVI